MLIQWDVDVVINEPANFFVWTRFCFKHTFDCSVFDQARCGWIHGRRQTAVLSHKSPCAHWLILYHQNSIFCLASLLTSEKNLLNIVHAVFECFVFFRVLIFVNWVTLLTGDFDNWLFLGCMTSDGIFFKGWSQSRAPTKQKIKIRSRFWIFYFHLQRIWIQKLISEKTTLLLV